MALQKILNTKRLTKAQVKEIVTAEGKLHEEYTSCFEETYASGRIIRDRVYELPGDRFLYVFDEKGFMLPGKGDIYTKDYLLRRINWRKRIKADYANKRASSVDHWRFYTKHKDDFVQHIEDLVSGLSAKLTIDKKLLDKSYKSLDFVSDACNLLEFNYLFEELYDNLVAYVGEVIKLRINGNWETNQAQFGGPFPYIGIGLPSVYYMPINAVWSATSGLELIDLRKEAANEVRLHASKVKFEREHIGLNTL